MESKENKLYRISEILEMEIFPFGYRTLLRKLQGGEIKCVKVGRTKRGVRYFVRGADLNDYYNNLLRGNGKTNSRK